MCWSYKIKIKGSVMSSIDKYKTSDMLRCYDTVYASDANKNKRNQFPLFLDLFQYDTIHILLIKTIYKNKTYPFEHMLLINSHT